MRDKVLTTDVCIWSFSLEDDNFDADVAVDVDVDDDIHVVVDVDFDRIIDDKDRCMQFTFLAWAPPDSLLRRWPKGKRNAGCNKEFWCYFGVTN